VWPVSFLPGRDQNNRLNLRNALEDKTERNKRVASVTVRDEGPLSRRSRIEFRAVPLSGMGRACKRTFDIVAATASLIMLSPLLLVVALILKLESREAIFSRETLYGYRNRPIRVFKFRSRKACSGGIRANASLSSVGRVLRRSGIDQIPKFINVIRGEMSIVGPRPYPIRHDQFESRLLPLLSVRPGMTGWAQIIATRSGSSTVEQRISDDLYYVENWSFFLDMKILLSTVLS
jgi:polysaccharide biosynthesis protein PslA